MEKYYLITSYFVQGKSYHYDIVSDIEAWIEETQQYDDEWHILINVLPISKQFAEKWDGNLHSM